MQILSDNFMNKIMDKILTMVDQTLKNIEKKYAVKSRYLSKSKACIYADISAPTLDNWLAKGLPVSKVDGCFRIDTQEIDKFMINSRM
ncbi:MAG: hypothetical protein RR557_07780 [Bacilli bacterium]